jgi:hypothetical protein
LMSILCLIQKRAEIRRNLHSFNLKLMYPWTTWSRQIY